jgi:pilus assembly protein CpaB
VIREPLGAGEPITEPRLARPGDRGFLAAVLSPGLRAITIPINETNSIAGLLFPGDRVDLIVTHDVGSRRVSETVMTNIRVLAVDARTQAVNGQPGVGRTVTIEVTPKQAESVIVARGIGSFSLALRSLGQPGSDVAEDTGPVLAERGRTHTYDSDVSPLVGNAAGAQNVVVMRGTATSSQTFQKVSK